MLAVTWPFNGPSVQELPTRQGSFAGLVGKAVAAAGKAVAMQAHQGPLLRRSAHSHRPGQRTMPALRMAGSGRPAQGME